MGASLRLDVMIDRAVAEFGREGVAIELREAAPAGRVFFRMPSVAGPGPYRTVHDGERPLVIADRTFVLVPLISQSALLGQQSAEVWVVLLAGMLFVALLEGILIVSATRRRPSIFDLTVTEARSAKVFR